MKCPRCGAETSKQRYCIYCGERLSSSGCFKVQRAPSGVMRMRYRGNISQTSLPEIQKRNVESKGMKLASLSSSQNIEKVSRQDEVFAMEVTKMKDNQESSARESKELQAMLNKLSSSAMKSVQRSDSKVDVRASSKSVRNALSRDSSVESADQEMISKVDMSSGSLENMNLNLGGDDDLEEMGEYEDHDSFFEVDNSGEQDVFGSIPMPSGSFAKTPSGGFHLIFDSIKSACSGVVSRIRSGRKSSSNQDMDKKEGRFDDSVNHSKQIKIMAMGAVLLALVIILVAVATGNKAEPDTELAAQTAPVAGNEEFAILPLDDDVDENFDFSDEVFDDDFSIPALEGDAVAAVDDNKKAPEAVEAKAEAPKAEVAKAEAPKVVASNSGSSRLTELRLYEHKDNVMASVTAGQAYKTKRSCIMRKGPASRFDLAKQISSGAKIEILSDVDEDWILESGSVWKKSGHTNRLGPGDQFAEAKKGMKIPQPKGRVISAKNWKYVKAGDVYGYVGPACFK